MQFAWKKEKLTVNHADRWLDKFGLEVFELLEVAIAAQNDSTVFHHDLTTCPSQVRPWFQPNAMRWHTSWFIQRSEIDQICFFSTKKNWSGGSNKPTSEAFILPQLPQRLSTETRSGSGMTQWHLLRHFFRTQKNLRMALKFWQNWCQLTK